MMTTEEIFKTILERMVKGLMVHEQLANYYDFLGLQGYRRCHEYHYIKENEGYRKMSHYYIKKYNMLMPEFRFDNPEIIPSSWYGYHRQEVDTKTKRQAVQDGLNEWVKWEGATCTLYEKMYKELIDIGEFAAAAKICELITEVEHELQTAEKYQLNKIAVDYDMNIIIEEQKPLHCKYKKMIKEE